LDKARLDEVGIRQEEEHPEFVLPLAAPSDNRQLCSVASSHRGYGDCAELASVDPTEAGSPSRARTQNSHAR
jgi:hypothetical protein